MFILFLFSTFFTTPLVAQTHLTCFHPAVCHLLKTSLSKHQVSELPLVIPDLHDFDPSPKEIKLFLNPPHLILPPLSIVPWAKKIAEKRTGKKTYFLPLPSQNFLQKNYPKASLEALSHFWLYPDIACFIQTELTQNLKIHFAPCTEDLKSLQDLLQKKYTKTFFVLEHDALSALFTRLKVSHLALKGSHHHEEMSSAKLKKLSDLPLTQVIWIRNSIHDISFKKVVQKYKKETHAQIFFSAESGEPLSLLHKNLQDLSL
ncbi:MAG: hypothetical protein KBD63_00085 [Bacteriovoracaceae bacterium]|nr:hypothetical protein [Bacteriovoracaceae bacterium]